MALVLASALSIFALASARAETADDFWKKAGIPDLSAELGELGLGELANVKSGLVWSADAGILGAPGAKLYLYKVSGPATPVLAIVIPVDLTVSNLTRFLFDDDGYLELGLRKPLLVWVPKGVLKLDRGAMPGEAQTQATGAGLPATIPVQQGLNLFGRVGGGFLGYLTKLHLPDPNDLTVTLASRKDKKDGRAVKIVATSVGISADAAWREPFGLADTTLRGATLRMTTVTDKVTKARQKIRETWGTARIRDKDYTAYLERDEVGLDETLAFDTKSASLIQFFDVLQVVSATLGIPKVALPSALPLDKVVLTNPKYVAVTDAASPPVFDNMMFMGTKNAAHPLENKLIVHGAAGVFGWSAARGDINASKSGVDADVALNAAKIGPIETPSASFYLKVNDAQQNMGVKAKTTLYGDLDLKAERSGLLLEVTPSCPLRPFGFKAHVASLTLGDFPIEPIVASGDCFRKSLENLVNGGEDAYNEVKEFVADEGKEAAETAEGLYKTAAADVDKYVVQRAGTWAKEIGAVKATKDAEAAARNAYNAALSSVKYIGDQIESLGREISNLTHEIENLLEQAWSLLTKGKLKAKKKARGEKISQQDDYRAQQPVAVRRRDDAKRVLDKATKEAAHFHSPYLSEGLAKTHEPLLGALAQEKVQKAMAQRARSLPADLANVQKRKELFAKLGTQRVAALSDETQTRFKAFTKISELSDAGGSGEVMLSGAKRTLVSEAIAARLDDESQELLNHAVAELPTMTYDGEYQVVLLEPGATTPRCLSLTPKREANPTRVENCVPHAVEQVFRFQASGMLISPNWDGGLDIDDAHNVVSKPFKPEVPWGKKYEADKAALFFFDPYEGVIRYIAKDSSQACVRYDGNRVGSVACPAKRDDAPGARWRLARGVQMPGAKSTILAGPAKAAAMTVAKAEGQDLWTNVAPMKLMSAPGR